MNEHSMNDVKVFKTRLHKQLSTLVPEKAKRELFVAKMEKIYSRMLEQKLARQQAAIAKAKPRPAKKARVALREIV